MADELYTFSLSRGDIDAPNFYMSNLKLIERFIKYFKEKAAGLINIGDKSNLGQFDQTFVFGAELADNPSDETVKNFLKETEIEHAIIIGKNSIVKLAPREMECMRYLAVGQSIKQIAYSLGLSHRTIEFYISIAKKKTGYNLTHKLISEFISQKLL